MLCDRKKRHDSLLAYGMRLHKVPDPENIENIKMNLSINPFLCV